MKTKEIIDSLRVCADEEIVCPACLRYKEHPYGGTATCYMDLMQEAADALEAALREQEERENPKPMTLDELLEMNEEPVWIILFDADEEFWALRYEWFDTRNPEPMILFHMRWYSHTDYGKTWLAYRSKPKEA